MEASQPSSRLCGLQCPDLSRLVPARLTAVKVLMLKNKGLILLHGLPDDPMSSRLAHREIHQTLATALGRTKPT